MRRIFLGSVGIATLALGAPMAMAEQHTGGGSGSDQMTSVTCEDFLALPAQEQEMHATALTTASLGGSGDSAGGMSSDTGESGSMSSGESGSSSMSSESGDSSSMDSGSSGSASMETDSGGSSSMSSESGSDSSETMATGDDDSSDTGMSSDSSGSAASPMQQSPTVVALVTICENSSGMGGGSDMESGSMESGSEAGGTSN